MPTLQTIRNNTTEQAQPISLAKKACREAEHSLSKSSRPNKEVSAPSGASFEWSNSSSDVATWIYNILLIWRAEFPLLDVLPGMTVSDFPFIPFEWSRSWLSSQISCAQQLQGHNSKFWDSHSIWSDLWWFIVIMDWRYMGVSMD